MTSGQNVNFNFDSHTKKIHQQRAQKTTRPNTLTAQVTALCLQYLHTFFSAHKFFQAQMSRRLHL